MITRDIWGLDDVQAVQLAMAMAGADLDGLLKAGSTASWGTLTVNPVMGCRLLSKAIGPLLGSLKTGLSPRKGTLQRRRLPASTYPAADPVSMSALAIPPSLRSQVTPTAFIRGNPLKLPKTRLYGSSEATETFYGCQKNAHLVKSSFDATERQT